MSWDVMIFRFAGKQPATLDEIEGAVMHALGQAAEVREKISAVVHGVNWSDPSWGCYDGDGFSIEFNVGKEDPIENMMLHVRGGGDAISAIMALVALNGWLALDCSTSQFLDPQTPSQEGWEGFQAYRDKIFKRSG